jgi:hypothetical protein
MGKPPGELLFWFDYTPHVTPLCDARQQVMRGAEDSRAVSAALGMSVSITARLLARLHGTAQFRKDRFKCRDHGIYALRFGAHFQQSLLEVQVQGKGTGEIE